jgi:hypothetical protein
MMHRGAALVGDGQIVKGDSGAHGMATAQAMASHSTVSMTIASISRWLTERASALAVMEGGRGFFKAGLPESI